MTRNGDWLTSMVLPTAGAPPKRSWASLSPRKATRRSSATSIGSMQRPPGAAMRLRIDPNSALMPEMSAGIVFVPYSTLKLPEDSAEVALRLRPWAPAPSVSSSRSRMPRPLPRPSYGIDVSPGQAITMRSPSPAVFLTSCLCSPVPKASIKLIATVPHTIPKTVRKVRNFSLRMSRTSCRRTSFRLICMIRPLGDLLRRALHDLVALLQTGEDLDVHAVGDAGLDHDLFRRRLRIGAGDFDRGLLPAVLEGDEPLRDGDDVLFLPDDDVGVRGVAGAQGDLLARIELDLDVEERGAVFLLRLRGDARDASGDDVGRQGADFDPRHHPDAQLADVDLVDGALENEVAHVGDGGHLGAGLIRGQRHDGIAGVHDTGEDRAGGRRADDRLGAGDGQPPFAREVAVLLGLGQGHSGELEGLALLIEVGLRQHAGGGELLGALVIDFRSLVRRRGGVDLAVDFGDFHRRRVGRDLKEGVAGAHGVADLDEGFGDDAGDLRLDRELLAGLDLPDRDGLLDDRPGGHVHFFQAVRPLAARHGVHDHGRPHQDDQRQQSDPKPAHRRSPRRTGYAGSDDRLRLRLGWAVLMSTEELRVRVPPKFPEAKLQDVIDSGSPAFHAVKRSGHASVVQIRRGAAGFSRSGGRAV